MKHLGNEDDGIEEKKSKLEHERKAFYSACCVFVHIFVDCDYTVAYSEQCVLFV
jgi:hypothetical protein